MLKVGCRAVDTDPEEAPLPEEAKTRKTHCQEDLQRRILSLDLEPGGYLDETLTHGVPIRSA